MDEPSGLIPVVRTALDALLPRGSRALIAVSGGPDSIALLTLAAEWANPDGTVVFSAATVDHGLRPESFAESRLCAAHAAALGISHQILHWEGKKPTTGIQAAARNARYRLLADEAKRQNATHILTAHHADDQAETILMRLSAGSGIAGLGGMKSATDCGGLTLVRPLLDCRKADLEAFCRVRRLATVDDPSNVDQRYGRSRVRHIGPLLAQEGLSVERLVKLGRRATAADEALQAIARDCLARAIERGIDCDVRVEWHRLVGVPPEIRVRALGLLLQEAGPLEAPVKLDPLERLSLDLDQAMVTQGRLRRTLAGRMVTLSSKGVLIVGSAPPRRTG